AVPEVESDRQLAQMQDARFDQQRAQHEPYDVDQHAPTEEITERARAWNECQQDESHDLANRVALMRVGRTGKTHCSFSGLFAAAADSSAALRAAFFAFTRATAAWITSSAVGCLASAGSTVFSATGR